MAENNVGVVQMLAGYEPIIRAFITGTSKADDFERDYLLYFKNDSHQVGGPEFDVLDELFADIDDYVADPRLREEVSGIDEEELRARAREAYKKLYGEV